MPEQGEEIFRAVERVHVWFETQEVMPHFDELVIDESVEDIQRSLRHCEVFPVIQQQVIRLSSHFKELQKEKSAWKENADPEWRAWSGSQAEARKEREK